MDPDAKKMLKQSMNYGAVGIEMGVSVIIGIVGGQAADKWLDTTPVMFWVGFIIGLGAAAKAVVDAARRAKRDLEE